MSEIVKSMKAKKTLKGIPINNAKAHNSRGGNNSNKFYALADLDDGYDSK